MKLAVINNKLNLKNNKTNKDYKYLYLILGIKI